MSYSLHFCNLFRESLKLILTVEWDFPIFKFILDGNYSMKHRRFKRQNGISDKSFIICVDQCSFWVMFNWSEQEINFGHYNCYIFLSLSFCWHGKIYDDKNNYIIIMESDAFLPLNHSILFTMRKLCLRLFVHFSSICISVIHLLIYQITHIDLNIKQT